MAIPAASSPPARQASAPLAIAVPCRSRSHDDDDNISERPAWWGKTTGEIDVMCGNMSISPGTGLLFGVQPATHTATGTAERGMCVGGFSPGVNDVNQSMLMSPRRLMRSRMKGRVPPTQRTSSDQDMPQSACNSVHMDGSCSTPVTCPPRPQQRARSSYAYSPGTSDMCSSAAATLRARLRERVDLKLQPADRQRHCSSRAQRASSERGLPIGGFSPGTAALCPNSVLRAQLRRRVAEQIPDSCEGAATALRESSEPVAMLN